MIKIYHNPRCSKSREGLAYLEEKQLPYQIIKYLDEPLRIDEIKDLLKKLNYKPIDLIRQKESIWIENYKGKDLSDDEIIEAMYNYPKLIERPIFVKDDKAVVGRPTEKIEEIL